MAGRIVVAIAVLIFAGAVQTWGTLAVWIGAAVAVGALGTEGVRLGGLAWEARARRQAMVARVEQAQRGKVQGGQGGQDAR